MSKSQSPTWLRSRSCDANACVEAALDGGDILVRDSKDPESPILRFTMDEWSNFVTGIRGGDFTFE